MLCQCNVTTGVVSCPPDHSRTELLLPGVVCWLPEDMTLYQLVQSVALSLQCTQGPVLERIVKFDRIPNTKYIRILKIHRIPNTEYIQFLKNERI